MATAAENRKADASRRAPSAGVDPSALLAIRDLELRARVVVEGLWAGLHRSPFSGFSVEFTEYRQYSPGDDLRYLDWRVLARSDRDYIKQFEDETNFRCQLLVDTSRSMGFGSLRHTKADYARTLAATLAYFLFQQRDSVGLALFEQGLTEVLPARWRRGHLKHMLALLERSPEGRETDFNRTLEQVAPLWRRRSLVVVLSDLLSPVPSWAGALGRLVASGHDVRVLQILDPAELTLEFGRKGVWADVESGRELYVDPDQARAGYLERFTAHQAEVRKALESRGVVYQLAATDRPLDFVLLELLRRGSAASLAGRRRAQR
jgi:uncharacterized protein (DUF58 family)